MHACVHGYYMDRGRHSYMAEAKDVILTLIAGGEAQLQVPGTIRFWIFSSTQMLFTNFADKYIIW